MFNTKASEVESTLKKIPSLPVKDMELEDQLRFALVVTEFARKIKPLVDKYAKDDGKPADDFRAAFFAKMMEQIANEDKS